MDTPFRHDATTHPRGDARVLTFVLAQSTGGIGAHVRDLAEYCVSRGDQVTVVCPQQTHEHFDFAAIGARTVPLRMDRPAAALKLRRMLTGTGSQCPDVVHAHGVKAGALVNLATAATPSSRRPRRVVTLHNALLADAGLRARVNSSVERLAIRPADVVLGASADLVRRAAGLGAKTSAFTPVPARDAASRRSARTRDEIRAELGVVPGERVILSIGRLAPQKSFPVLLDALRALEQTTHARPLLLIAGDGPDRAALAERIRAENQHAVLLGHRTDIADLLAAADVFALASQWEARSLAVQEALRAGVPVVATRVGGLPDLVGDAALLVPWNDASAMAEAIGRILMDNALRDRLAESGPVQAGTWPGFEESLATICSRYS